MEIGFVGLGKMGGNMVERLLREKHSIVAYNHDDSKTKEAEKKGATGASSLKDLVSKLKTPRTVWLMIPSGEPTNNTIEELSNLLSPGDLIVDGGNSKYTDSVQHAETLKKKKIHFMDAGTSGGIWGLKAGYCMMVGGEKEDFQRLEPALKTLAPNADGYLHCGPAGSGHFVKMVHNGIEYGMMQAYAEGFEIMKASPFKLNNLGQIAHLWNQGSVVRSWLLELAENAFKKDPNLDSLKGYVEDSGEGRWTVQQAIDTNVPAPVITASLFARFYSRKPDSFTAKVLAALRNEFGGHAVKTK